MFVIDHLRKTFKAPGNVTVNAVDDISLEIADGRVTEFLSVANPDKLRHLS